jgi:hypothetical protein
VHLTSGAPRGPSHCPRLAVLAKVPEAGGYIDGGAISQRDYRAEPGDRHQAPAHLIFPDDGQQAAVQDTDLFAKHPPDNEQRFD